MRPAYKAVLDAFVAAWGSTTPIALGNESIDEPGAPWVRISMTENTSEQLTIGSTGNKIFERRASVRVQIFVPTDRGDGALLDLQQQARNVFEGKSVTVAGEPLSFFKVDADRGADEPHLIVGVVEAQCRYQERK